MSDIGVYVRPEVLRHKQNDGKEADDVYCYYTFAKPLNVDNVGKLWFAAQGRWQGYFEIRRAIVMGKDEDGDIVDLNHDNIVESASVGDPFDDAPQISRGTEIRFFSESWHDCDGGPRKPFQGATYRVPLAQPNGG